MLIFSGPSESNFTFKAPKNFAINSSGPWIIVFKKKQKKNKVNISIAVLHCQLDKKT